MNQGDRAAYRLSEPRSITELLLADISHQEIIQFAQQHFPQDAKYWLLECRLKDGTQWLVFEHLVALSSACEQIAAHNSVADEFHIYLHAMKGRAAAGLLFTRHPERFDLGLRVLEIVPFGHFSEKPQRWVFDAFGHIHYHQGQVEEPPLSLQAFVSLAKHVEEDKAGPQQLHWWHDGQELYLLAQTPMPALGLAEEAWCQADELWAGAVSPLWYSCSARWFKTHFWRPLGERNHWQELENIEPYRRQGSHLYFNARFALALAPAAPHLHQSLPPDWLHAFSTTTSLKKPISPWRLQLRLRLLQFQLGRGRLQGKSKQQLWQHWMHLDQMGEKLARLLGELYYCYGERRLHCSVPLVERFGADPLLPYVAQDQQTLSSLSRQGGALPTSIPSRGRVKTLGLEPLAKLYQVATELWHQLGTEFRKLAEILGLLLTEQGQIPHPDAVYFLYFDELWELLHQQGRVAKERLAQRQHQYMQAALMAAPQWQLAGKGYQGGEMPKARGLRITGRAAVEGEARGAARLVHSSWCLNEVSTGEVIILKHYHLSWLPWLKLASAILLVSADDAKGALTAMAVDENIPMLMGVQDGLDYFSNSDLLQVKAGETSWVAYVREGINS